MKRYKFLAWAFFLSSLVLLVPTIVLLVVSPYVGCLGTEPCYRYQPLILAIIFVVVDIILWSRFIYFLKKENGILKFNIINWILFAGAVLTFGAMIYFGFISLGPHEKVPCFGDISYCNSIQRFAVLARRSYFLGIVDIFLWLGFAFYLTKSKKVKSLVVSG